MLGAFWRPLKGRTNNTRKRNTAKNADFRKGRFPALLGCIARV